MLHVLIYQYCSCSVRTRYRFKVVSFVTNVYSVNIKFTFFFFFCRYTKMFNVLSRPYLLDWCKFCVVWIGVKILFESLNTSVILLKYNDSGKKSLKSSVNFSLYGLSILQNIKFLFYFNSGY